MAWRHSSRPSRARAVSSSVSRLPAIPASRESTASLAVASSFSPLAVSTCATRRRSSSACLRSTSPRLTSPSTTAVMLGGRTASLSASADDTADPSVSSPRIRYWGSDRSADTRASSTCLASHAAVRPMAPGASRRRRSGRRRPHRTGHVVRKPHY